MSEYIERGALIAFVSKVRKNLPKDSKDFFTRDEMLLNFQQYIEHRPAADVEPVVHEPCEFCRGEKTEYSDSVYGKFFILKDRLVGWCIAAEFSQCPPFADCAVKNMKLTHLRQIKNCPNCGRKLDLEEGK